MHIHAKAGHASQRALNFPASLERVRAFSLHFHLFLSAFDHHANSRLSETSCVDHFLHRKTSNRVKSA